MSERVEAIRWWEPCFRGSCEHEYESDCTKFIQHCIAQAEREREVCQATHKAAIDDLRESLALKQQDLEIWIRGCYTARAEVERLKEMEELAVKQALDAEAALARTRAALTSFATARFADDDWCFSRGGIGACRPPSSTVDPWHHVGDCARARAALEGR